MILGEGLQVKQVRNEGIVCSTIQNEKERKQLELNETEKEDRSALIMYM